MFVVNIEDDAAFAGVEIEEEGARLGVGTVAGEGSGAAGLVALRRLDLDNVGPELSELFRAEGAGGPLREVEDREAVHQHGRILVAAIRRRAPAS